MAKKKSARKPTFSEVIGLNNIFQNDIFNFIFGIITLLISVFLVIAFISFIISGQSDQSIILDLKQGEWSNSGKIFHNSCGSLGAFAAYFFISRCFGFAAFAIPLFFALVGLKMVKAYSVSLLKWFMCLSVIMLWSSVALSKFLAPVAGDLIFSPGGDHGLFCCQWLENVIGVPGLMAVLLLVAIIFLTYISSETITVIRKLLNPITMITNKVKFDVKVGTEKEFSPAGSSGGKITTAEDPKVFDDPEIQIVDFNDVKTGNEPVENNPGTGKEGKDPGFTVNVIGGEDAADNNTLVAKQDETTPINPKEPWTKYKYPTLDLLKKYDNDGKPYIDMKEQMANKNRIVEVLNNFGVQVRTITATVGPTITLYEITLEDGIRVSKIRNLEDDIALSLSALGIRIIAPIPGKGTIGIEVPNAKPNIVSMESILNSKKFQETTMDLPIAIGKTITNEVFMVDLAKIPHLLVAGATGQGKSVGLNAIITSLLYKKHPNELKLVLIDPKKVEFSIYSPIVNHFLAKVPDDNEEPIITDVTKVIRTLNSLCKLMDTRYDLLKTAGVRNIKEYNKKYINHKLNLTEGHEYMPYIVVIIDEFGDLIMTAGKEIELPIARIAQLARAVGIHMVIATQRPTTSIITGNIKANFPGRMAFRVGAMIDSRTILDRPGANQLIGRGDLLFLNGNEPTRVQCAFVDTPEVERINQYIQQQPGPVEPMELPEPSQDDGSDLGNGGMDMQSLDPLFEEAARAIIATQQGSTSMIQRRFSIGYNRAGRLMDQMEKLGIVGAAQGGKPREVLIQDENSLTGLMNNLKNL